MYRAAISGFLAAAALLAGAAGAQAATTRLVSRATVAPDTQRLTYRYGPLEAVAGQNLILAGPVTVEKPPAGSLVTRVQATVVDGAGRTPPVEQVHMHHAVMVNLTKPDAGAPSLPERFYGFAEEKTVGQVPPGYAYPVAASDIWAINYMLHNETPVNRDIWIEYTVDVVPGTSATGRTLVPVHPLWIDTRNGSAYPVFDVHRGAGRDGRFTFPDDVQPSPYAGTPLNEWRPDHDVTLVAGAGHVHPGGLWTDLDVRRGERSVHVFRSVAEYFDPNGPVSWDMAMTYTPPDWRVGLHKGDVLRVSATYDTTRASWYESMGLMLVYYADQAGPDPFTDPPPTTGEVTHGHLQEAGNHGGGPTGLADPSALPEIPTVADGVAIGDFLYTPGDLSASGVFRGVPVVQPGGRLHFGNFDATASIYHSVTSCRAPCTGATGVSYPLADGPIEFDSGQLGYGPQGFTAAAQRPDWYTPPDLPAGTYTYFCRVHPFMRGAFRVAGTPAPASTPAAPTTRRRPAARPATRTLRVHRRRVRIPISCAAAGGACRGTVALRAHGRTLGRARLRIPAGRTRTVTVRIARRARTARLVLRLRGQRARTWRVRLR